MSYRSAPLLLAVMAIALLSGCVIDHTGRSGSYLLQSRMDTLREKNRGLEQDVARERGRVDRIEQRASEARRRYADAGASVQALMEDLSYLRGDVAFVKDELGRRGTLSEDMDLRLSGVEGQLVHVEDALVLGLDGYSLAPVVMPAPVPSPSNANPASGSEPSLPTGAGSGGSTSVPAETAGAKPEAGSVAGPVESAGSTSVDAPSAGSKVAASVEGTPQTGGVAAAPVAEEVRVEPAPPGPAEVLFTEGKALYTQGKWRDAGRRFLKIRKKHSSSEHVLESQFLLSMCLFELQRYKDALSEFQKVIDARGSVELSAQSMYMQGMSFLKLGTSEDREAAEIFFGDVTANWPKSSWAKKAKKELGALRGN